MSELLVVSRRKAAMFIAGAFAGSAGPSVTVAAEASTRSNADTDRPGAFDEHRRIAALLRGVRSAGGAIERKRAFERSKSALLEHNAREAFDAATTFEAGLSAQALYRTIDPSIVLLHVIVRELDAWPKNSAGWLERFSDLETVFASHVRQGQQLT